ncbi:MAG: thiamine phosphate synthase [Acidobacteria bacterium]|nr:thiamine phosphate synthase [Acidobacteriota bacterium]
MIRCYITDRRRVTDLRAHVARIVAARHADWIQVREKDLPARDLYALCRDIVEIARPAGVRVLVNERADVAKAAGADGIHLPSNAMAPWRFPGSFCGVSCHNEDELLRAQNEGASYVVLGPVFAPGSKTYTGNVMGLAEFARLAKLATIPVLALGGITAANASSCMDAGAAGIAAISLFDA